MKDALAYAVLACGGVITASVGAVAHRGYPPFGVLACVVMVALAAVFARAWLGYGGLGVFAGTWMVATFVWSLEGPGGSVLIAQDALGVAWLAGASIVIVAASVVPSKWLVGEHGTG
ncbi:hypothetical protein [Demequina sp.]|uniref:hypothetical protein n=1 Tax=Demequina sp. TaxID=2050685 RepID=UPI003A83E89B